MHKGVHMNKKLIAAAVASVIAGPAAISVASADVSVYGTVYVRATLQDSKLGLENGSNSRFGFKSTTDLGNGNTVSGGIEVGFDASDGQISSGKTGRLGHITYAGDWGSLRLGSAWSVMGTAQGHACPNTGQACGGSVNYQSRVADAIVLKTTVGGLDLNGQVELDGGTDLAGWAISTGIDVGPISLGVGHRDYDTGDVNTVGASATIAGVGLGAVVSSNSANQDGWAISANVSGLSLTLDENASDAQEVTANYNVDLGGGSSMKFGVIDADGASAKVLVQWAYGL
jgi:predicted porin